MRRVLPLLLLAACVRASGTTPPVASGASAAYLNQGTAQGDAQLQSEAEQANSTLHGPALASRLTQLGELAEQEWRYPLAESLYVQALAEAERSADQLVIADALAHLARIHRITSKYRLAEEEATRALTLRERLLGASHPSLAPLIQVIAFAKVMTDGDFEQAETLGRRALAIAELHGTPSEIAAELNNLAAFLRWSGKTVEAERRYREALERYDGLDTAGAATAAHNLAGLLLERHGATMEVSALEEQANRSARIALGPRHPFTIETLEALANIYRQQQRGVRSLDALNQAREARREPPTFCVNARGTEGCLAACSPELKCAQDHRCVSLSEVRMPRGAEATACLQACSELGATTECVRGWVCSPVRQSGLKRTDGVCAPP